MDESLAWLNQALSDRLAAERFGQGSDDTQWCHAVAKYQQTVEKAVKAIVAAVRKVGISLTIGYTHPIEPLVDALIRSPRTKRSTDTISTLSKFFNLDTRLLIQSLEALIPRKPPPGELHRRNTEYPFEIARDQWNIPAAPGAFSAEELGNYRRLASRIVNMAEKIISSICRAPK